MSHHPSPCSCYAKNQQINASLTQTISRRNINIQSYYFPPVCPASERRNPHIAYIKPPPRNNAHLPSHFIINQCASTSFSKDKRTIRCPCYQTAP